MDLSGIRIVITLPNTTRERAIFRILTMPEGTWNAQVWTAQPVPEIINRNDGTILSGTVAQGGFHVRTITRWCIPDEDRAEFYIDTGIINGFVVAAPDLSNKAIRIQVIDDETFPGTAVNLPTSDKWKTIWAGTVIYMKNQAQPGASLQGRTTYFCAGVLWRTRNWPLDRHSTTSVVHAKGHPGYNVPLHGYFRKVLGNASRAIFAGQDPFGDMAGTPNIKDYYQNHSLPIDSGGAATPWSDVEVVKHALASSRAKGEPLIQVNFASDLFNGSYAWPVNSGDTCWDLLRKICNRQRGRGSVYVAYTDTDGNPLGPVIISLVSTPSFVIDIVYLTKSAYQDMDLKTKVTMKGAALGTDAIDIDINGDHRVVDGAFNYDNRLTSVYDYIDVQGEPIQVLANLNFFGSSLAKRWSPKDETDFGLLTLPYQRIVSRWRAVWRRFGPPTTWDYKVTGEPGGVAKSINYRMDVAGTITNTDDPATTRELNSSMTVRILPAMPIYEGWNYSVNPPVRFDNALDTFPPPQMPPLILTKGSGNAADGSATWASLAQTGVFNIQVDDYGVYIINGVEDVAGLRVLATPALAPNAYTDMAIPGINTTVGYNLSDFNVCCGVELGARIHIGYANLRPTPPTNYETCGKRLLLTINGIHLWLGSPGCIWELDTYRAASATYAAGLKFGGDVATILRDDRDSLAQIAALAWEYYGKIHNPAVWALNDCGFLTSFASAAGAINYPTIGKLVGKITYTDAAPAAVLNTPITCVHYDHDQMQTTWHTDYVSYDGNLQ